MNARYENENNCEMDNGVLHKGAAEEAGPRHGTTEEPEYPQFG